MATPLDCSPLVPTGQCSPAGSFPTPTRLTLPLFKREVRGTRLRFGMWPEAPNCACSQGVMETAQLLSVRTVRQWPEVATTGLECGTLKAASKGVRSVEVRRGLV